MLIDCRQKKEKKKYKKITTEHYIRGLWEGKQKWKQRERDREGKQVNANRKQELALINRKVSIDSDKCAIFMIFPLEPLKIPYIFMPWMLAKQFFNTSCAMPVQLFVML